MRRIASVAFVWAATTTLILASPLAGCERAAGFTVADAQFQPPFGGSGVGVGYFAIRSKKADRIVKVSSTAAKTVEIHEMTMAGQVMSMPRRESVDLPAGKTIEFKPGGLHLMVFSPAETAPGAAIPITIELQSGLKQTVEFKAPKIGNPPN